MPHFFHRVELEGEIRLTVDELMREELKNLKMVWVVPIMHSFIVSYSAGCGARQGQRKERQKGQEEKSQKGVQSVNLLLQNKLSCMFYFRVQFSPNLLQISTQNLKFIA